ncbi:MAG TPA: carboxymuconolactone decarboxylase family protein [Stellaceae bacterium]|nr:carboxymuconolactone decarboxylase family protein [Stellaceae bacterium]
MTARIAPMKPPYPAQAQAAFDRIMPPGVPPLSLFTTLARDPRLFERFRGGSLLDKGHLTLRQREIVIDRVTALSGSEYEWGVHIAFFAERAGLDAAQQRSLVRGNADDPCWSHEDRLLLRACDTLHAHCDLDDALWRELRGAFSEEALIEILMLAGFYRMVSYLTNALRLPLESYAARFPA